MHKRILAIASLLVVASGLEANCLSELSSTAAAQVKGAFLSLTASAPSLKEAACSAQEAAGFMASSAQAALANIDLSAYTQHLSAEAKVALAAFALSLGGYAGYKCYRSAPSKPVNCIPRMPVKKYIPTPILSVTTQLTDRTMLVIQKGDITESKADAIVNAANAQLEAGGGVCGAIFAAAGKDIVQVECNTYPTQFGDVRCPVGQARITGSGELSKKGIQHIIHAVGPDCRIVRDKQQQDALLADAYKSSLELAYQHKITSIAFPFISSAIYEFPKQRAATIALKTIIGYLKNNSQTHIREIRFVLFSQEDFDIFRTKVDALAK